MYQCKVGPASRAGPARPTFARLGSAVLSGMFMKKLAAMATIIVLLPHSVGSAADDPTAFFEKRVRPILVKHCYRCHGPDEAMAGLRLDSRAGWQTGGKSGPAIVPGKPDASLLIRAISYRDKKLRMPPPDDGGKLGARQIADLIAWVRSGAVDPRAGRPATARDAQAAKSHWAFQPIRRIDVPAGQHPVDFFIHRVLQEQAFTALSRADQHTLIRRAVYDLHGLPPTKDQFSTPLPEFGKLVDSLLASPRYGERWGRYWLDVARYADTKDGVLMYGDNRIRPFAYTYRDYVIRAFNDDKPFDRFIHEQLAADQLGLPPDAPELAAMGFLTLGRMFDRNRHDVIDDQIDVVTRGFLGLTASCARCHDHKFDPIPTADYYSLHGIFASSEEPFERPRIESPAAEGEKFEKELAEKIADVKKMQSEQHNSIIATARERTPRYLIRVATTDPDISETAVFFLSLLPQQLRPQIVNRWRKLIEKRVTANDPIFGPWHDLMNDFTLHAKAWRKLGVDERVIAALVRSKPKTPEDVARTYGELFVREYKRTTKTDAGQDGSKPPADDPLHTLLAGRDSPVWFPKSQVWYYMSRKEKDKYRGMVSALDMLAVKSPHAAARAMIVRDSEEHYQPVIFRRGDPTQPGAAVPRRFLAAISAKPRMPFPNGGGRLDLAKAITAKDNPLTARVLANRVWLHHFGEPLVDNPSDFGLRTNPPAHPALLDFLASELIQNGWRLKPLHRLIMTSAAWQRTSKIPDSARLAAQHRQDPTNRWFWRANRRRLDLESMRDTLLSVSGQLEVSMFGRPASIDDPANRRRTVYALVERQNVPSIVRNFDFASPDASAARRNVTTVPQQALFALNSEFATRAAKKLAGRIEKDSDTDKIEQLHQIVFGRQPTEAESRLGLEFIDGTSLQQYAQVLLMTNELMFVD